MNFKKFKLTSDSPRIKKIAGYATFIDYGKINSDFVKDAFDFAYDMTFGQMGEHRDHRTGGTHQRSNGEIFANTFQGKLCEFAIYQELRDKHEINKPDLSVYGLGKWDNRDFQIDDKTVSVKSTKSFGQLLLLETKDWTAKGEYIPNGRETYDCIFMVRIKNDPESIMKNNKIFFLNNIEKDQLWNSFENIDWIYDVPRYITYEELVYIINNDYIIFKNDLLNGKTLMDADNYYCHLCDMHPLKRREKI